MAYAVLEKEIKSLPLVLQKEIEDYALFVINRYKQAHKPSSASDVLSRISGVISNAQRQTAEQVREERLSLR